MVQVPLVTATSLRLRYQSQSRVATAAVMFDLRHQTGTFAIGTATMNMFGVRNAMQMLNVSATPFIA
jgi:hypothetical protein